MKLIQTLELTEEEKEKFFKFCERTQPPSDHTPCGFVNCEGVSCSVCPLSILNDKFIDFQDQLEKVKKMIK